MNSLFIFSTESLAKDNSAASSRVLNYAKTLASVECDVYLYSMGYENIPVINKLDDHIFYFGNSPSTNKKGNIFKLFLTPISIFFFVRYMYINAKKLEGKVSFLLYPSTKTSIEFFSIFYLIFLKKQKVYLETNEVRKYDNMFFLSKSTETFKRKIYLSVLRPKFYVNEYFKKYFSGLICISKNIHEHYEKYNENIIRIPILCDVSNKENNQANSFNIPEKFLICFTGWVAIEKDNLHMFLESLHNLKKKYSNIEFHLYGKINKANAKLLLTLIKRYNLNENVYYKGLVNQKELPQIMKSYHLLVIPRGYNLQNHYGFSTKLADYIVSGIPFLVTDVSDNKKFITDNVNGFIVPPDDEEKMTEKMLFIINNYNRVAPIVVENAFQTAKKYFSYTNYSENLKQFFFFH